MNVPEPSPLGKTPKAPARPPAPTPGLIRVDPSASWFPPALRGKIPAGKKWTVRFSEAERKIFRKHRPIPVSRWCERYRTITMSVLPGRWKNSVTPYLKGIMDASFYPTVQTVILCKAPQVGGTEAVLNCLAYAIDREPGPAMCIYPDELTAKENSQDRIQPMIHNSPRLRIYLTGQEDDASILRINLQHMPIYMAWARSAARLANKPIRYMIFDEIDKYADTAGKREADPISLGEARTTTFRHNRKIWKISTPTTEAGNIWQALTTEAQCVFDYWTTCPACGHHHRMAFSGIQWAHKETPGEDGKCHSEEPETIEAEKLAWYVCPKCAATWNDYDRDLAVRRGQWRERKSELALGEYLKRRHPVKIGFHLPSWISPFVSFSAIAASFLRGQKDMNKFKDWHNKHLAEPWRLIVTSRSEDQILAARTTLPPQTVPAVAVALTCGVDVQKDGFWFVVRAWAPDLTSWLIHYGFLATWEEVENLIYDTAYPVSSYPGNYREVLEEDSLAGILGEQEEAEASGAATAMENGRTMRIFRAAVDTGGGKKFENMTMTEETYYWLIKNRGRGGVAVWGTKGASVALAGMLSLGNAIVSTPSGKKLPAALRILSVDTGKAKDQYHYRLQLATQDDTRMTPAAAFLHAATGTDYAAQILAEQKRQNEHGQEEWVNVHQRANHLFDAEVLAAACVEMEFPGGGLRLVAAGQQRGAAAGDAEPRKGRRIISRGVDGNGEESFIGKKKGWFKR